MTEEQLSSSIDSRSIPERRDNSLGFINSLWKRTLYGSETTMVWTVDPDRPQMTADPNDYVSFEPLKVPSHLQRSKVAN